jgi:uncharacterized protein (TIGR03435 family)
MVVMRLGSRLFIACGVLLVPVTTPRTIEAQAVPSYDISTVKPHDSNDSDTSLNFRPANLHITNQTVQQLIAISWNVRPWLVSGLPPWGKSDHFDVDAKVSEPDMAVLRALPDEDRRLMMQNLLRDRFHLSVHAETRTLPVYELSVVPDEGAKLKTSPPLPPAEPGRPAPRRSRRMSQNDGRLTGTGVTIRDLADHLANELERYVVDRTGLTGDYDLTLKWTPEDGTKPADAGMAGETAPPLATAVREQLGLRLTPAKGSVPTIVVDHIEPPTDN